MCSATKEWRFKAFKKGQKAIKHEKWVQPVFDLTKKQLKELATIPSIRRAAFTAAWTGRSRAQAMGIMAPVINIANGGWQKASRAMSIDKAISYEYPMSGQDAETVATLDDGRICIVNTQYATVFPLGDHKADCDQILMGSRCTCGLLGGIDVAALVDDARTHGKCGRKPKPSQPVADISAMFTIPGRRCPKCDTYCHGDCRT